jgi:hypothetical protein
MLGSYHRPYDAKLLLLAVPGCAALWSRGGRIGKIGLGIMTAAIIATSDIPIAILSLLTRKMDLVAMPTWEKVLTLAISRPAPLALFLVAILFLGVMLFNSKVPIQTNISRTAE